jgi:hypothetical protein
MLVGLFCLDTALVLVRWRSYGFLAAAVVWFGSVNNIVFVVVAYAYYGLFPPCWRCYDLLKVCRQFVVGVPMLWLSDYCPDLLRSAGVKVKVCLLRTAAALISVSIFVIDFGLIWNPHHSICLMLDSWSRKRHVELVVIFAGSWSILNCLCVGRQFIRQLKIRHSFLFDLDWEARKGRLACCHCCRELMVHEPPQHWPRVQSPHRRTWISFRINSRLIILYTCVLF